MNIYFNIQATVLSCSSLKAAKPFTFDRFKPVVPKIEFIKRTKQGPLDNLHRSTYGIISPYSFFKG